MTTYKNYEFAISVTEIKPPLLRDIQFAGKLQFLFDHKKRIWIVENGKVEMAPLPLSSEFWGHTREEASARTATNVKHWIDKQQQRATETP